MGGSITNQNGPVRWVIMGVCGCGKSTLGRLFAEQQGVVYLEGDAFHPPVNVEKMSAGQPLDDNDRAVWLRALELQIRSARLLGVGLVVSCSALRRRYRDVLREGDPQLRFVHLAGPRKVLAERLAARQGHYMPPSLLDSQLATLEPLQPEEGGVVLDIRDTPVDLVAALAAHAGKRI